MRNIGLVLLLLLGSLAHAQAVPEIISWQQYQAMNMNQRQIYLKEVAQALQRFEEHTTALVESEQVAQTRSLLDLLAGDLVLMPQAFADGDAACDQTLFFTSHGKPCYCLGGTICTSGLTCDAQVVTNQYNKCATQPNNGGARNTKMVSSLIAPPGAPQAAAVTPSPATPPAQQTPKAATPPTPDSHAAPPAAAVQTTDKPSIPAGGKADKTKGDSGNCLRLNAKDLAKARADYRKPGNQCLIGGVISKYKTANSYCPTKQSEDVSEDKSKKAPACTDHYTTGDASKVNSSRWTVCNSLMYCKKGKTGGEPTSFCVEASRQTLSNCEEAVNHHQNEGYMFGQDCIGNDRNKKSEQWEKFKADVAALCSNGGDSDTTRKKLLCQDCHDLSSELQRAESKSGAPPAAAPIKEGGSGANTFG